MHNFFMTIIKIRTQLYSVDPPVPRSLGKHLTLEKLSNFFHSYRLDGSLKDITWKNTSKLTVVSHQCDAMEHWEGFSF
jgi:hypothetical protein